MGASEFAVVLALVLVAWVIPLVTALKGKPGLAVAGILFHPCWWFGAIR